MHQKMWAVLLHLSMNMWEDYPRYDGGGYSDTLKFDYSVWEEATAYAAKCGFNTVVIDLGNGVKYQSHPEIAVKGALEVYELKKELKRLRALGLTPIPKLNFSTGHDAWLGEYSRMVSTKIYYQVCRDLIHEVIDIFDMPPYFHLGMDEEKADDQVTRKYHFVCFRQEDLLWHDLKYLLQCVLEKGVTPWIWADYYWYYPEEFVQHVSKEVLLSSWYYHCFNYFIVPQEELFQKARKSYMELDQLGYRQVPCGSNFSDVKNIEELTLYCGENISNQLLEGFLMAPWYETTEEKKHSILEGIHLTKFAKAQFEKKFLEKNLS